MCEYWEVTFNGYLITRGTHSHALTVLTQLHDEGINATLRKVYPS